MIEPTRRFTPPWDIEDNGACFIIRDENGQAGLEEELVRLDPE